MTIKRSEMTIWCATEKCLGALVLDDHESGRCRECGAPHLCTPQHGWHIDTEAELCQWAM